MTDNENLSGLNFVDLELRRIDVDAEYLRAETARREKEQKDVAIEPVTAAEKTAYDPSDDTLSARSAPSFDAEDEVVGADEEVFSEEKEYDERLERQYNEVMGVEEDDVTDDDLGGQAPSDGDEDLSLDDLEFIEDEPKPTEKAESERYFEYLDEQSAEGLVPDGQMSVFGAEAYAAQTEEGGGRGDVSETGEDDFAEFADRTEKPELAERGDYLPDEAEQFFDETEEESEADGSDAADENYEAEETEDTYETADESEEMTEYLSEGEDKAPVPDGYPEEPENYCAVMAAQPTFDDDEEFAEEFTEDDEQPEDETEEFAEEDEQSEDQVEEFAEDDEQPEDQVEEFAEQDEQSEDETEEFVEQDEQPEDQVEEFAEEDEQSEDETEEFAEEDEQSEDQVEEFAEEDEQPEEYAETEEERKERIRRKYMVLDDVNVNIAKIMVIGVGGAGNNAVNRMITSGVSTAKFVAVNTDKQALLLSRCDPEDRYQIGLVETKGLGAGADPEIGERAAVESKELIEQIIDGVDLLFIAAGMGGGTGTGAAPVIAKIAKEKGIVTVAVVTKPFSFEGKKRERNAEKGIANLEKHVDTMIIIPNDKLMEAMRPDTPIVEALRFADDTLRQGICGIADLIATPSLINLDFADVRTTLKDQGLAHMGIGTAKGENRIVESVKSAVSSPLLETTIEGAMSIILNVTGGKDLTLMQVTEAARYVREIVDPEANVIFGMNINDELQEEVIITLIATGFNKSADGIADANKRAYNDLFAANDEKTTEPDEYEPYPGTERDSDHPDYPEYPDYQSGQSAQSRQPWTPDRGYGGGMPRDDAERAPYRSQPTERTQPRGYDEYRQPYQDNPYGAYNAPTSDSRSEDQKAGLPGFVKRLFGGKKK